MDEPVITWLLEGDPAVRWQVERDLAGSPREQWEKTRSLISSEGWGRRLLEAQDESGTWGGGLYTPKWISTTYTLLLLRRFGLDPANEQADVGTHLLLDWMERVSERCVNGMVLSIASWFDVDDLRIDDMADLLVEARMKDGGWNCRDRHGATHSSFHTTVSALEGLLEWKGRRRSNEADDAIASGHEFMLHHHMFRSHTTGEVINQRWARFSFPPRWHYDILRGLDHLRDAEAEPDPRAEQAIEIVKGQEKDGRWPVGPTWPAKVFFTMEDGQSTPGRWNTLRSLRVLEWWESR